MISLGKASFSINELKRFSNDISSVLTVLGDSEVAVNTSPVRVKDIGVVLEIHSDSHSGLGVVGSFPAVSGETNQATAAQTNVIPVFSVAIIDSLFQALSSEILAVLSSVGNLAFLNVFNPPLSSIRTLSKPG